MIEGSESCERAWELNHSTIGCLLVGGGSSRKPPIQARRGHLVRDEDRNEESVLETDLLGADCNQGRDQEPGKFVVVHTAQFGDHP